MSRNIAFWRPGTERKVLFIPAVLCRGEDEHEDEEPQAVGVVEDDPVDDQHLVHAREGRQVNLCLVEERHGLPVDAQRRQYDGSEKREVGELLVVFVSCHKCQFNRFDLLGAM